MKFNKPIDASFADLACVQATEICRSDRPSELECSEIHIAPRVFQPRQLQFNIAESDLHIRELVRVLRNQEKPLDPLVVVPVGQRFFVIDGHHRLAAYEEAEWRKPIPVEILDIDLRGARERSIALNIKNKLAMTANDKLEVAWLLVKEGYSKKRVEDMSTASNGTIATMKRKLRLSVAAGQDVSDSTWREMRRWKPTDEQPVYDDWADEKAMELAAGIMRLGSVKFIEKPEVLAKALEIISEGLPRRIHPA